MNNLTGIYRVYRQPGARFVLQYKSKFTRVEDIRFSYAMPRRSPRLNVTYFWNFMDLWPELSFWQLLCLQKSTAIQSILQSNIPQKVHIQKRRQNQRKLEFSIHLSNRIQKGCQDRYRGKLPKIWGVLVIWYFFVNPTHPQKG